MIHLLKRPLSYSEVMRAGLNSIWLVSWQEKEIWTHRETPEGHVQRGNATWEKDEKVVICKSRRMASGETMPGQHLDLGFSSLQNYKKKTLYCFIARQWIVIGSICKRTLMHLLLTPHQISTSTLREKNSQWLSLPLLPPHHSSPSSYFTWEEK